VLRFHRKSKGFTLIELMIVVAIIGILAAIAIPRFANLIDRARQARTQGNLGSLRSALSIYYGSTEGIWPAAGTLATLVDTYIDAIPGVLLPASMNHGGEDSSETNAAGDTGNWFYDGDGTLNVNCTCTEVGGTDLVNTW